MFLLQNWKFFPNIILSHYLFCLSACLEKAMAPHSSTLAWKIPWMEEPGRLQSMGSLRVRQDWATSLSLFTFIHWRRKWQPTPMFLPGESQGWGSLVGCRLWGHTESDWSDLAAAAAACLLSRFSHVWLFVPLWTVACQSPLSVGFSRSEYWSGLPCPSSGFSQPRDWTCVSYVSCIGRQVLYH